MDSTRSGFAHGQAACWLRVRATMPDRAGPPRARERSERVVFQKRAQVARGGLEVPVGQPDHERLGQLEKAPALTAVEARDLGARGHRVPPWCRSRCTTARRCSWSRTACSRSGRCRPRVSRSCARGTSRGRSAWRLARGARIGRGPKSENLRNRRLTIGETLQLSASDSGVPQVCRLTHSEIEAGSRACCTAPARSSSTAPDLRRHAGGPRTPPLSARRHTGPG